MDAHAAITAFGIRVTLGDGRQIVEQTMLETRDGLITRQVEVEAWD